MKVGSHKFITLELSEQDAWLLEQVLTDFKQLKKDDGVSKFSEKLLTDLSKERVRKI